jgi:hypothetical protein
LEFACLSSEAVLAPGLEQKKQLVKKMGAVAGGGAAGVAAILAGLAGIFGWGAGVVASIHAFFFGVSLAGPIALIASGVVVAAIAGYWALTSDDRTNSSRAYRALQSGCANAVDAIWAEYGDALAKTASSVGMKKKRKAVARRPTTKASKKGVLAKP